MAIFKYFSHEAHAQALIAKGLLMMQSLAHFRGREADGIRGDPADGVLMYAPEGGLTLNMEDGRKINLSDGIFNSSVRQDEIFVYCASNQLSVELAQKFGPYCVEIADPEDLVRRLKLRSHPTSRLDYSNPVFGNVEYRDYETMPGADWAIPERLVLIKPEHFAWQDEYRIAVGSRTAMNAENVGVTIQKKGTAPAPIPSPRPIFLPLGSLSDCATLHHFAPHD